MARIHFYPMSETANSEELIRNLRISFDVQDIGKQRMEKLFVIYMYLQQVLYQLKKWVRAIYLLYHLLIINGYTAKDRFGKNLSVF